MAAKRKEHVDQKVRHVLRIAAARLLDRLPELADELVKRVREGDEAYRRVVTLEEHWRSTEEGLRIGIEAILQRPAERRDLEYARSMASRRAEQGLPLDSLMRMYRLAAQVTWAGFVELIEREHPELLGALVRTASHVWHAIDRQALTAAETYRRREKELLGRSNERVNALLDDLLEGTGDAAVPRSAAAALDLPERGRYAVVTIRLPVRHGGLGAGVDGHPETLGPMRLLWRMRTQYEVAVVALGDGTLDELIEGMTPGVYGPAGVSPVVDGLEELASARKLAELAMRTCSGCGPQIARLDRRLPAALVVSQPELSGRLTAEVLGALLALDPPDREILLATLSAWLRCEGSAARAAGQLYCHRNTVFNRIRRVEQLTGRSVSRPRDIVELALALEAVRLLPVV
ncbi:PucR family transcriptional regulator [Sphaerisporangium perillae]|uniref:PucR family transcriptional regulator n=1 Tax=Sphaerisporangium perillae TaxID=2935860 RepID=UPI00200C1785|nr:helix-turn-helix domain-containing protein [Sphaerisporangium perillae]